MNEMKQNIRTKWFALTLTAALALTALNAKAGTNFTLA